MNNNSTRQDLGDILYCVENSVEYWTVKLTGESAVSIRGLAKMSGIPESTIRRWLSDLRHEGVPKELKCLLGKVLYLSHLRHKEKIKKRGKAIKPILVDIAAEIIEYAAFELGKKEAIATIKATNKIGFTSWVQGKTGWLPEEFQASKEERDRLNKIIQTLPRKWELHFDRHWQRAACQLTGYRWKCDIRMARFISCAIYKLLPKDVYDRLMAANAERKSCHHQFFTEKADELILKQHIQRVYGLILASNSQVQFWRLMSNAFSDGIQIELEL